MNESLELAFSPDTGEVHGKGKALTESKNPASATPLVRYIDWLPKIFAGTPDLCSASGIFPNLLILPIRQRMCNQSTM
jgi:hypothetical protein